MINQKVTKNINIVLIGYRGVGKTTIARVLADMFGMPLFSVDNEIEKEMGLSVYEISQKFGWERFRAEESKRIAMLADWKGWVIDSGGGVILEKNNVVNLKKNGVIFWLKANVDTIIKRLRDDVPRPSLTGSQSFLDETPQVLKEREPKYMAVSDHIIDANGSTAEIADEIIKYLEQNSIIV